MSSKKKEIRTKKTRKNKVKFKYKAVVPVISEKKLRFTSNQYKKYLETQFEHYPDCKIQEFIALKHNKKLDSFYRPITSRQQIKAIVTISNKISQINNKNYSVNLIARLFLSSKIRYLMRKADGVIVGNNYIEKYAKNSGATNILALPTVIDIDTYINKPSLIIPKKNFRRRIISCW